MEDINIFEEEMNMKSRCMMMNCPMYSVCSLDYYRDNEYDDYIEFKPVPAEEIED